MKRNSILLYIFIIFYQTSFSQNKLTIYIYDRITNQPIEFATITQSETKLDTNVVTKISNEKGQATFAIKANHLYLTISQLNYISFDTSINFIDKDEIELALTPTSKTIEEVTIISQKKTIEPITGGYTFNPDKKTVSVSRNTLELLKHLPGVLQDKEGKLKFLGANITYWIDGKQADAGGQDLKNLSANEIKSITVYTTPPSLYDACCGNVIEIITYKNLKKGLSATLNGNIATGNKEFLGLSLKYNNKRYSGLFKISYDHYNTKFDNDNFKQYNYTLDDSLFFYNSVGKIRNEILNTLSIYNSHDFALKRKNIIGFTIKYNDYERLPYTVNNDLSISNGQNIKTSSQQFSRTNSNSNKFGFAGISYRQILNSKGSNLAADVSVLLRTTPTLYNQLTKVFDGNNNFNGFLDVVQNKSISKANVYTTGVIISHSITPNISSRFGGKLIFIKNTGSYNNFISTDAVNYKTDSLNTYKLNYLESVQALFFTMNGILHKIKYTIGVRWEGTNTKINSENSNTKTSTTNNYSNLFPSISINYQLTKSTAMSLGVSRSIIRIAYPQLNPLVRRLNSVISSVGNPYLKPITQEAVTLTLNSKISNLHSLNFMTRYSISHNPWLAIIYADTIAGQYIEKNTTYKSNTSIYANLAYKGNFKDWFTLNVNVYTHNTWNDFNNLNNLPNPHYKFTYGGNIGLLFSFWKDANIELKGQYQSPQILPQGYGLENAYADLSFSKPFFKEALQISIDVGDIFNSSKTTMFNYYPTFSNSSYSKNETRVATLSITYSFGNERKNKIKDYQIQGDNRFTQ